LAKISAFDDVADQEFSAADGFQEVAADHQCSGSSLTQSGIIKFNLSVTSPAPTTDFLQFRRSPARLRRRVIERIGSPTHSAASAQPIHIGLPGNLLLRRSFARH
jgi:hypothetical protein